MLKRSSEPLTEEKKRELELFFLEGVQESFARSVARAERGEIPKHWEGDKPPTPEEIELLRAYHRRAGEAIEHIRSGGAIEDTADILWGRNRT